MPDKHALRSRVFMVRKIIACEGIEPLHVEGPREDYAETLGHGIVHLDTPGASCTPACPPRPRSPHMLTLGGGTDDGPPQPPPDRRGKIDLTATRHTVRSAIAALTLTLTVVLLAGSLILAAPAGAQEHRA